MNRRDLVASLIAGSFLPLALRASDYRPKLGFVPDETTALKIAEAVLSAIYGEDVAKAEQPFSIILHGDAWKISGHISPDAMGGVAEISIDRKDGRISNVRHSK